MWIIDFSLLDEAEAKTYKAPYAHVRQLVWPERQKNKREAYAKYWWQHVEARPAMLAALAPLPRFLATVAVSKHRLFTWLERPLLPDHQLFAYASSEDWFFGILHSRFHEVWARSQGTQVRERESGFRYTPTTCFETFPFPFPLKKPLPLGESTPESEALAAHHYFTAKEDPAPYGADVDRAAIAAAAQALNELRERWLNPPEWTRTDWLEFPATVGGPWDRFIDRSRVDLPTGIGTARYPRLVPRDEKCVAKLKPRTLTALYNERPAWLDLAHRKLDAAVAAAYGWPANLNDEEILARLLALNLARAKEETEAAAAAARNTGPKKPQRQKHNDELI